MRFLRLYEDSSNRSLYDGATRCSIALSVVYTVIPNTRAFQATLGQYHRSRLQGLSLTCFPGTGLMMEQGKLTVALVLEYWDSLKC
jgi:hypothetical protein